MSLNYKKMVEDIDDLVESDFCLDMDCKNLPGSEPVTQKEAREMIRIIGEVYSIAHCIHCEACRDKYLKKK